jgi:hypothetical protein
VSPINCSPIFELGHAADRLLALGPERLCALGVEGVGAHAPTNGGIFDDLGDVAVLADAQGRTRCQNSLNAMLPKKAVACVTLPPCMVSHQHSGHGRCAPFAHGVLGSPTAMLAKIFLSASLAPYNLWRPVEIRNPPVTQEYLACDRAIADKQQRSSDLAIGGKSLPVTFLIDRRLLEPQTLKVCPESPNYGPLIDVLAPIRHASIFRKERGL